MPKIRSKTSKREPIRRRFVIAKKVKAAKHRMKKEVKKMKGSGLVPKSKGKDQGIPNLYPYKEQMLNAIERKNALDASKKEKALKEKQQPGTYEEYADEVKAKVTQFNKEEEKYGGLSKSEFNEAKKILDPNSGATTQSRRAYVKELRKVVEESDVVLEVLDARDPEGCRNKELEKEIV